MTQQDPKAAPDTQPFSDLVATRRSPMHPPHIDSPGLTQFVTFRLVGSLPADLVARWRALRECGRPVPKALYRTIEKTLDDGYGPTWLADGRIAAIVQQSLLHFHGTRLLTHGWVVQPNHVHWMLTPANGHSLAKIMQSVKSFTARTANQILGRTGAFWQEDYHDTWIRSPRHFFAKLRYMAMNPVYSKLVDHPELWPWSHVGFGWKVNDDWMPPEWGC